jgi:hypothetical protein
MNLGLEGMCVGCALERRMHVSFKYKIINMLFNKATEAIFSFSYGSIEKDNIR